MIELTEAEKAATRAAFDGCGLAFDHARPSAA
jgi:hypothetical protein